MLSTTTNDFGVIFSDSSIPLTTTDVVNEPEHPFNRHSFSEEESLRVDSGFIRINISDTGPGISKVSDLTLSSNLCGVFCG
jgi:hypothetical protein